MDELGRDLGEALLASLAPAVFDGNGATLVPSELAQPLHKGGDPFAACGTRALAQEAADRHLSGLLRPCRERPRGCRAAEQRDELATFHSITSSARDRNDSGIVSPRALAVVRLITRSNLVGCSTGISPGFLPCR